MLNYNFNVVGDRLTIDKKTGVTGNIQMYLCNFVFNADWDEIPNRIAVFDEYAVLIEDDKCCIPWEVLQNKGYVDIGVYGTNTDPDNLKRISTNTLYIEIETGAYRTGTVPDPPELDFWEQTVQMLKTRDNDIDKKLTIHSTDTDIHVTTDEKAAWNAKQDKLTFDDTPAAESGNPVKSGGVYAALDTKADKATTLSGYGITDAYTKTETNEVLDTKADKADGKGLSANDLTDGLKMGYDSATLLAMYNRTDVTPSPEEWFMINEDTGAVSIKSGVFNNVDTNVYDITRIVIPWKIGNAAVRAIDTEFTNMCDYTSNITELVIPNSVTKISDYAFYSLTWGSMEGLKCINIPISLSYVGNYAFSGCTSLTSINIPNDVNIEAYAFDGCTNLTIYCEQGSYAETYAQVNNIPVKYTKVLKSTIAAKADKTAITQSTDGSITLADNTELRVADTVTSISLTVPDNIPNDFISSVVFKSGIEAMAIDYSAVSPIWRGDDVTDGVFIPLANKVYNVIFYNDGFNITAVAGGYDI